jgi:hypothetical protein
MASTGTLTETIRVRVDEHTKVELDNRAAKIARKPSDLARRYIRDGLERDGLVDYRPERLRDIIDREREHGRAFGFLADACRAELAKRGLPA